MVVAASKKKKVNRSKRIKACARLLRERSRSRSRSRRALKLKKRHNKSKARADAKAQAGAQALAQAAAQAEAQAELLKSADRVVGIAPAINGLGPECGDTVCKKRERCVDGTCQKIHLNVVFPNEKSQLERVKMIPNKEDAKKNEEPQTKTFQL